MTTHFNSKNLLEPDGFLSGIHLFRSVVIRLISLLMFDQLKGLGKLSFWFNQSKGNFAVLN